jgi:hypothetical protein
MKKLLLHSCCAPCSSAVLERLIKDYDVTVFFYNPNIRPYEEYKKRLSELKRFLSLAQTSIPLFTGEYYTDGYIPGCCEECFTLRLEETAKTAVSYGMDCFSTTLTASSKKNADDINEICAVIAKKYSINRLWADFKKDDGYNRSVELCNKYNLYRQGYCGCRP